MEVQSALSTLECWGFEIAHFVGFLAGLKGPVPKASRRGTPQQYGHPVVADFTIRFGLRPCPRCGFDSTHVGISWGQQLF